MDENQLKERITGILTRMYNSDPVKLTEYRALFRKAVPLSKRSYFTAFLLSEMDSKQPKEVVHTELMDPARLFFNIGKRNRVFVKEMLSLILSRSSAKREEIGHIRLFQNYTFVEVEKTAADGIIEALNGLNYRGRQVTVSYARSREDYEAQAGEPGAEEGLDEEQGEE
jgi:hypothetical protein